MIYMFYANYNNIPESMQAWNECSKLIFAILSRLFIVSVLDIAFIQKTPIRPKYAIVSIQDRPQQLFSLMASVYRQPKQKVYIQYISGRNDRNKKPVPIIGTGNISIFSFTM